MSQITASQVKELRERTGAGIMDAKKALVESEGNIDQAITILREKGIAKAAKKGNRIAAEGMTYIDVEDNAASIVEVNSETDFVATNDSFNNLIKEIANTAVAEKPKNNEELLSANVSNGNGTIEEDIIQTSANTGEKITLRRFDVIEKENDNQSIGNYTHNGGSISALVLINGKDDKVAKDIAMHISAANPKYVSIEDVPKEEIDKETSIQLASEDLEGKPENIKEKMVKGRVAKIFNDQVLTKQPFVKNPDLTVEQFLANNNSSVVSFVRYQVGEGIDKKTVDLADEVSKQLGN